MGAKSSSASRPRGEEALRPSTFADVVGQHDAVENLMLACSAAKGRGEMPGHMLLEGPAGTGKTTLALCVSRALGKGRMVPLFGGYLHSAKDLLPTLMDARKGDVIFIDEIHRMFRPVQELLFPVMEDGTLALGMGSALRLPPITIVGATTDPGRLLTPMLDRFSLIVRLSLYDVADLVTIATHGAAAWGVKLDDDAAAAIGAAAEGVPRVALRLVRAARDRAIKGVVTLAAVQAVTGSSALVWRQEGRDAG